MTTSRRKFLVATASGIGAAWLGVGCGEPGSNMNPDEDLRPKPDKRERDEFPETELDLEELVISYFEGADLEDVRLIGRVYLQRFGSDDEASIEDLSKVVELVAELDELDAALAAFDSRGLEDFKGGRLVDVGGWQLARTESRLCGLAYHLTG